MCALTWDLNNSKLTLRVSTSWLVKFSDCGTKILVCSHLTLVVDQACTHHNAIFVFFPNNKKKTYFISFSFLVWHMELKLKYNKCKLLGIWNKNFFPTTTNCNLIKLTIRIYYQINIKFIKKNPSKLSENYLSRGMLHTILRLFSTIMRD